MRPSNTICLFLAVVFSASLFYLPAKAATNSRPLVATPSKIEINARPGQKIKSSFTISNNGDVPAMMKLSVKDFKLSDEKGGLEFYKNSEVSMDGVLIPEFLQIGLNSGEKKQISFIAAVPEHIKSGGYYGAILFESVDDKTAGPKNPFGVLILMTVSEGEGQASAGIEVNNFSAGGRFLGSSPADFSLTAANPGNAHLITQALVSIKNWRNREVANFNAGNLIFYPEAKRTFEWKWSNKPKIGFYRAEITMTPLKDSGKKFIAGTWFIIFPWAALVYPVLALLGAAVAYFFLRKKTAWSRKPNFRVRKILSPQLD